MKKLIAVLFFVISFPAFSYDWAVNTRITLVEPTGVPDRVKIKISDAAGPCEAGSWLIWEGKTSDPKANVEAIYSAALSAMMGDKTVRLYGDVNCKLEFMHVYHD